MPQCVIHICWLTFNSESGSIPYVERLHLVQVECVAVCIIVRK